jgi:hypothetical protein
MLTIKPPTGMPEHPTHCPRCAVAPSVLVAVYSDKHGNNTVWLCPTCIATAWASLARADLEACTRAERALRLVLGDG